MLYYRSTLNKIQIKGSYLYHQTEYFHIYIFEISLRRKHKIRSHLFLRRKHKMNIFIIKKILVVIQFLFPIYTGSRSLYAEKMPRFLFRYECRSTHSKICSNGGICLDCIKIKEKLIYSRSEYINKEKFCFEWNKVNDLISDDKLADYI